MVQRKDDHTPPPPGGRAAERLREFENARRPAPEEAEETTEPQPPCEQQPAQGSDSSTPEKEDPKSG